jgi:hypothetical protein
MANDIVERLSRCIGWVAHVNVVKLFPRVGMTRCLAYRTGAEQFVEAAKMLCITFRRQRCRQVYVAAMASSQGLSNLPGLVRAHKEASEQLTVLKKRHQ